MSATTEQWLEVGPGQLFPEGRFVLIKVGEREVGILRKGADLYGLRNTCPHALGPVCTGIVERRLIGPSPGTLAVADDPTPVIACPWHGWEFDVRTGYGVWPSQNTDRVRAYEVRESDGRVFVRVA